MRTLRNVLLVAAVGLSMAPGAQAITPPPGCTSNAATGTCTFSCIAGSALVIEVVGTGIIQGDAQCGGGHAHCGPVSGPRCTDTGYPLDDDFLGKCDRTTGIEAHCYSIPVHP